MEFHDFVGIIGLTGIVLAYSLLQLRVLDARNLWYLLMNLIGSLAIIFSLLFEWNTGGFIINLFWVCISVYGLIRRKRLLSA